MIESLDVKLWGKKVGTLISSKKGYGTQVCFYFDSQYLKSGYDVAPLRAPLSGVVAQKGLPVYPEKAREFGGLPSFIADSLPDRWGNMIFTEWAKAHNIRKKDLSPLDRLAYIGRRGMGALEFEPPMSGEMETPFRVEISELSRLAQMALTEAENFHAIASPDFLVESLFKVGTSAGGRRPKAVVNVDLRTGECFSGQVPAPMDCFTPMIVKFDEHSGIPTTIIEYSYYLVGLDAGMVMMPSRLIVGENEAHFLSERFDRAGTEKIHTQTLAAMNPLATSYEDLFDVASEIGIGADEIKQLFVQMTMNVVGANIDDHSKNFSFMMARDGVWHVAPAYDYTFSVDTSAPYYVNTHCLTINGKVREIAKADLLAIADRYGVKGASKIIEDAIAVVRNYRRYALKAGVPEAWINRIEEEIESRISEL